LSLFNCFFHVGGKEQITIASLTNNILEARFVDREIKIWAVPGIDTSLVQVNNGDLDVGAFKRDDCAGRAT